MFRRSVLAVMFLVVILALVAGCGKGKAQYGETIPGNVKVVKKR